MSTTSGEYPINAASDVGLFRLEVGDVTGVEHDPVDGQADYEFFSDDAIRAVLAAYPDRDTAKSRTLTSMATQLIISAQDIQVDDIRIKTVERARLMLELATGLGASADASGVASAFNVVPLTSAASPFYRIPQGISGYNAGESGF